MTNDKRLELEMTVCRAFVRCALAQGVTVSVYDGGDWPVKRSAKFSEITAALRSVDTDELVLRDAEGNRVGWARFVYGNEPYEVIQDHTDNALLDLIVERMQPVADRVEARCNG